MSIVVFGNSEVEAKLRTIADGSKVTIRYFHARAMGNLRKVAGQLRCKGDGTWVIFATATQRFKLPNDDYLVVSIDVVEPATRAPSQPLVEEENDDEAFDLSQQQQRQQPPAEQASGLPPPTGDQGNLSMPQVMSMLQSFQASSMQAMLDLMDRRFPQPTPRSELRPSDSQEEINRLLLVTDALRGQDNPLWRVAPGLILNRFIPEKFLIVSIPHLLFKDVGGEMLRVPVGTAVPHYKSILSNCKLQFPNQVQVRSAPSGKDPKSNFEDITIGVRSQIERSERMFCDLLSRLDNLESISDFPTTKTEWMIYVDCGVQLLELYATLAFGFHKGGGKISTSYASAIATGKFDPAKLWDGVSSAKPFRE